MRCECECPNAELGGRLGVPAYRLEVRAVSANRFSIAALRGVLCWLNWSPRRLRYHH